MLRELAEILTAHARRYPSMAPCDAVKLVFQNEFGGGHLIADPGQSLDRLCAEYKAVVHDPDAPLAEDIGSGMVRIMLSALRADELETLNADFVRSARRHTGSQGGFRQKIGLLRELARQGIFGFSSRALEDYLEKYRAAGCPPASHSPEYRAAYRPAYRVVRRSASKLLLFRELDGLRAKNKRAIVAIDGRCASGKTSLAKQIEETFGFSVIHMDHFFLRPEQRTAERYAEPGGNIDHERFSAELLLPLRRGQTPVYRPFDCQTQTLLEPIPFAASPVVVVEGSYSCCPALWEHYDLRVFLTIDAQRQMERILARDGAGCADTFRKKWIPLEEQYFSDCQIESKCNYQLDS